VQAALGDERTLLVLDNFEQVLAARTDVAGLLDAVPGVVVLVTSRQALRLRSERQYPLAPLAGTPASQLFAERAAAVSLLVAAGRRPRLAGARPRSPARAPVDGGRRPARLG